MERAELLALADVLAAPYRVCPPELRSGGPSGMFAGTGDGQSVDFHDFREYQPGDDLRRVDWRAYARHGQMHLKLFREEVSPVVEIHLDTSASMSAYPGKEQAVLFISAFLRQAVLAAEGRPAFCRDGMRFAGREFVPALLATVFAGAGDDSASFPAGLKPLRFHLSDYLFDEGVDARIRRQSGGSLAFTPVLLLSRSERDPAWRGHCRLLDVEHPDTPLDLNLTGAGVAAYRERLRAHVDGLERAARRVGARLIRVDVPDGGLARADCEAIVRLLVAERAVTAR